MRRKLRAVFALAILSGGLVILPASPAHAAVCTFSSGVVENGNVVVGTAGNDTIDCSGSTGIGFWIFGGGGNDSITGTNVGTDVLVGDTGDDTISGLDGSDLVYGGAGNDQIDGGAGLNDFISGDAGNDTINGADGNDVIDGGAGNDGLSGGAGTDLMSGGAGADSLNGGTDIDALAGPAGDGSEDSLDGGGDDGVDDFCSESEGDIENCP
jgi:Ca2+-binding RTX toxin-like protein